MDTYKTTLTNTVTGESSVRYCETSKGFAFAVAQAIDSVEDETHVFYMPDKWVVVSEIVKSGSK